MSENNKLVIIENKLLPQSQSSISKTRFIIKFWVLREHQGALLSMCCGKHLGTDKIWAHRRDPPAPRPWQGYCLPHLPTLPPPYCHAPWGVYCQLPVDSPTSESGGQFWVVIVKA